MNSKIPDDHSVIAKQDYIPAEPTRHPCPKANEAKLPIVGSIQAIHRRLVSEGYQISEYMLRQMVKQGIIPAVYSGCKALISYSAVVKVLTCATG